jgi:predicted RNA-binding Zn-ribbon protein involved in translation (DUF1610 family)
MPTPAPTTTCPKCGFRVDLADPRVTITPTIDAGYAFCPDCGEIIILDADTTRRARVARGEKPEPPAG